MKKFFYRPLTSRQRNRRGWPQSDVGFFRALRELFGLWGILLVLAGAGCDDGPAPADDHDSSRDLTADLEVGGLDVVTVDEETDADECPDPDALCAGPRVLNTPEGVGDLLPLGFSPSERFAFALGTPPTLWANPVLGEDIHIDSDAVGEVYFTPASTEKLLYYRTFDAALGSGELHICTIWHGGGAIIGTHFGREVVAVDEGWYGLDEVVDGVGDLVRIAPITGKFSTDVRGVRPGAWRLSRDKRAILAVHGDTGTLVAQPLPDTLALVVLEDDVSANFVAAEHFVLYTNVVADQLMLARFTE